MRQPLLVTDETIEAEDWLCLQYVLTATTYSSQRRGMSWFGLSVGRCRAQGITVMD